MRSRLYRRKIRHSKIRERRKNIKNLRRFYSDEFENGYIHGRKIMQAAFGCKPGLLGKGYYGAIGSYKKTKTKNSYASYRHRGGYGRAKKYSRHDKRQIVDMKMELEEYYFRNKQ